MIEKKFLTSYDVNENDVTIFLYKIKLQYCHSNFLIAKIESVSYFYHCILFFSFFVPFRTVLLPCFTQTRRNSYWYFCWMLPVFSVVSTMLSYILEFFYSWQCVAVLPSLTRISFFCDSNSFNWLFLTVWLNKNLACSI